MPEQLEELIVRNLVEALNRLHEDLDRVELWTLAMPSASCSRLWAGRPIPFANAKSGDPFFSCRNGQSPRPERELFAARPNH
jgi:hypothetical protein